MYSGNGEQFSNWQIAAQAQINNLSANNIDWASLAQQWISMREEEPQAQTELLDAPPPPHISSKSYHPKAFKHLEEQEQGEAEMDMDSNSDSESESAAAPLPAPSYIENTGQFETIPLQLPVPRVQPVLNYNLTQYQQSQQDWEWPRVQLPPPVLHIPQVTPGTLNSQEHQPEKSTETLDENKRKSLPAWLREGLEKMEKEKQKQMEKEKFNQEDNIDKTKKHELEVKKLVKNALQEMASDKSDSESEEDAVVGGATPQRSPLVKETTEENPQEMVKKSHEEIVEEMMLVVRKSLTELLLEVTNEEILSIAQEQYKRKKSKASTSVQVFHKSALSAITGNLGLGAYDDSSDEADSDNENSDFDNPNTGLDSEDEIRTNLRIARKNFRSIEQTIEDFLMNDQRRREARKEESEITTQRISKSATPESRVSNSPVSETSKKDIGETQPEKRYHGNGKRSKERTSRFSENKGATSTTFFVQPHQSTATSTNLMVLQSQTENPLFNAKVASPTRKRRRSDSSDEEERRSNSSKSSSKYSYKSSRSSYRHKKSSRRSDDDSDDYYSSSRHSKRSRHKHKRSKSRSRSRSRSKSSYSSSSSKRRR